MQCEQCGKNNASVHVTRIVNGQKTESHLCQDCAQEYSGMPGLFSAPNIFASLFEQAHPFSKKPQKETICPTCNIKLSDLYRYNQFGCSDCYTTFKSEVEPIVRRLHGATRHVGKVPKRGYHKLNMERRIDGLRSQLDKAIVAEKYEEAAKLRDEIRDLENGSLDKEGD